MTGLRYSPLHVTELCGEMQGKFKVDRARLIKHRARRYGISLRVLGFEFDREDSSNGRDSDLTKFSNTSKFAKMCRSTLYF